MAKPQPPPTSGDVLFGRILSVTVGSAIGGLGSVLGFGSEAEDRNLVAAYRVVFDEAVDPMKLLRIEVEVLSMSGFGGAGAMAQLFGEIPRQQQVEVKEASKTGDRQQFSGKWFSLGTEKHVVNLTGQDCGAAVLFVWSEALLINMLISIAATFLQHHQEQQPDVPVGKLLDADAPS